MPGSQMSQQRGKPSTPCVPHGFHGQSIPTPSGFYLNQPTSSNGYSTRPPPPPPPPPPPHAHYQPAVQPFLQPPFLFSCSVPCDEKAPPSSHLLPSPSEPPSSQKRPRLNETHPVETYSCDACSLSFESKGALAAHESTHVSCTACQFRASPKAVKAHFQACHGRFSGSGFKTVTIAIPGCPVKRFRICVGNRPEDIAAWRSERRRRFPRLSGSSSAIADDAGSKNDVAKADDQEPQEPVRLLEPGESRKPQIQDTVAYPCSVGGGLSSLLDGYGSSSDEESVKKEDPPTSLNAVETTALEPVSEALLTANDEAGNSNTKEEPKALPAARHLKRPCRFFARHGSCRNGESCRFSHELANRDPADSVPRSGTGVSNQSSNNNANGRRAKPSPPSLLEKLLASDIRRERLLTIQLLEHIAWDANFFDPADEEKDRRIEAKER